MGKSLEINSNKGQLFEDFCAKKEINHQLTTADMPAHNGSAEVAVQIHKNMIKKVKHEHSPRHGFSN